MGIPDCQNSFKIGLTVLTVTQQRRVTDRHVHRHTYTLRLSVVYIVPKSRTERPRKTKIGTEVAHVTRDSDTTFKVKCQGHQAALLTAVLAHETAAATGVRTCWPWETAATLPSAQPREAFRRQRGKRRPAGAYRGGMPTYSLFILTASVGQIVFGANRLWGESSVGRDVHGRNAHGAKRLWGEMSFHGAMCPWCEMSVGRKVHKPPARAGNNKAEAAEFFLAGPGRV